ncbi:MAG: DeoR/GlpR family DNA-binding transcription regulator, partial [Candidatus Thiodiazotropha sp.]|nr:DeoR/GlpR family DNA-binding transcription regulator [Candidatus Thiodiazotropha sp.]
MKNTDNKQGKLSADQRQEKICEVLETRGKIAVAELAEMFQVTMQTIRRDLKELNTQNRLSKSHGKAVKNESLFEPMFHSRLERNVDQKNAIGAAAVGLISDNDTIVCDATTTVYSFLCQIENRKNIAIFINSLIAARILHDKFLTGSL